MADPRRYADLAHGHPGELTYIPSDENEPGKLISRRMLSDGPHFSQIGSTAELYPASRAPMPDMPSRLYHERRDQMKWLQGSHQEAYMGGSAVEDILKEDLKRSSVESLSNSERLLASGQITDVSDPKLSRGTNAVAMAAGGSGALLRLVRVKESRWAWDEGPSDVLHLSVVDARDPEEEVIWASDPLPISKIQFATSLTAFDPTRWLVVQKESSTMVLQPQYHSIPVSDVSIDGEQTSSRISPNPVLTITVQETGGAHADFAFNPRSHAGPPQLIILDACGQYTVWDILGTWQLGSHTLRPSLLKRGSMRQMDPGLLKLAMPSRQGLLAVGKGEMNDFSQSQSEDTKLDFSLRSRVFLMWNSRQLDLIDLESGAFLPHVAGLIAPKERPDPILDVQISPVNRDHFFVLTSRYLFWVDMRSQSVGRNSLPTPKIIMSCLNLMPSSESARLAVCAASDTGREGSLVLVYAPRKTRMRAFWFDMAAMHGLPQWHTQEVGLAGLEDHDLDFRIQSLDIAPAHLAPSQRSAHRTHQGIHFFQCNVLGEDLSLRHCIFAARQKPQVQVTLPGTQIVSGHPKKRARDKKKRRKFLRLMGEAFVVPDELSEYSFGRQRQVLPVPGKAVPRQMTLKFDRLVHHIAPLLEISESALPSGPETVRPLQNVIVEGVVATAESMPLMTWAELLRQREVSSQGESNGENDIDLSDILDMGTSSLVMPQLRRPAPDPESRPDFQYWKQKLASDLLSPTFDDLPSEAQQSRTMWIEELAMEMFLSSWGVLSKKMPLFGADDEAMSSQFQEPPSSQPTSSQPSSSQPNSSTPDPAFQRLSLLAPTLQPGTLGGMRPASTLSHWPTEHGVDPNDYISSVARATDSQFDDARQRLQRIEAKKAAQRAKFKRPSLGGDVQSSPAQPGPSLSQVVPSSQVRSSQSQGPGGITASQPTVGVSGDTKKKKAKVKKRSGFR